MKDGVPLNPLDLAVALHYDGQSPPQVTAKGRGGLAERILALAEENHIPVHADPHLARVLSQVPLGGEIPTELYVAVAEVIAFAYWLEGKDKAGHR